MTKPLCTGVPKQSSFKNNNNYNVRCNFQMQKLFEELETHFCEEQEKTKLEVRVY